MVTAPRGDLRDYLYRKSRQLQIKQIIKIKIIMSNPFDKDYKEPKRVSDYMKFLDGKNTFRIISAKDNLAFFEAWDKRGDKPEVKRWTIDGETDGVSNMLIADSFAIEGDPSGKISQAKTVWAMIVWNYQTEKIEILSVHQRGIKAELTALFENAKWGSIDGYDIVITREKTGNKNTDVKYLVTPEPKEEISEEILAAYKEKQVNLQALFTNDNPFEKK